MIKTHFTWGGQTLTVSNSAGARLGALPIKTLSGDSLCSLHGSLAATCPFMIMYGVVSYRWMKLFAGNVLPPSKTTAESLTTVVSMYVLEHLNIALYS